MKLYIGSSSAPEEAERARKWARAARDADIEVMSTWINKEGDFNSSAYTHAERYSYAYLDMMEVIASDTVWLLMPPEGVVSAGAFWELGCATALNKKCYISGPGQHASVFTALATVSLPTDEEMFRMIKSLVR